MSADQQNVCSFCKESLSSDASLVPESGNDYRLGPFSQMAGRSLLDLDGEKVKFVVPLYDTQDARADWHSSLYDCCQSCYYSGVYQLIKYRKHCADKRVVGDIVHCKNALFMTTRLQNYLDTDLKVLPRDFITYRKGGENEDMCLFCKDTPAEYPVHVSSAQGSMTFQDTETFACRDCNIRIDHKLKSMESERGMFSGYSPSESQRIKDYVDLLKFEPNVHLYYQHGIGPSDIEADQYIEPWCFATMKDKCYFCQNTVYPSNFGAYVEVPVPSSTRFIGGKVIACNSSLQAIKAYTATTKVIDLAVDEICATCGGSYSVTTYENRVREIDHTTDKHMCPACTFKQVFLSEKNVYFDPDEDQRHKQLLCAYCTDTFHVDLTIPRKTLVTKYVTKDNKLCCSDCKFKNKIPIFVSESSINGRFRVYAGSSGEFLINIYNQAGQLIATHKKATTAVNIPFLLKDGKTT